jgi:hypothetical protein
MPSVHPNARRSGAPVWRRCVRVTVADPGREFAFNRSVPLAGTVEWRYQFAPENGATRVIESYTVMQETCCESRPLSSDENMRESNMQGYR